MPEKKTVTILNWLGLRNSPDLSRARWLGRATGFAIVALLALAAVVTAILLVQLFGAAVSPDDGADVRNIGLVLAAIIGAPFVIWRSAVAAKTASVAAESLFNDKINAAAEDLAARRQITTVIGEGDARQVLTEWRDDLVTRAAAVDRLEGLVEERPDAAPRVARLLSVYVKELSGEIGNAPKSSVWGEFHRLLEEGMDVGDVERKLEIPRDEVTVAALRFWAGELEPVRSDMERAAQTLGRLKDIAGVTPGDVPIDLRGANLQGFDLRDCCFEGAEMRGARMEGADLIGAEMQGANLSRARMQGAILRGARMEGADLWEARMEGARLIGARMEGANLIGAEMQGANLSRARMQGAILRGAQFDADTDFAAAVLQYAAVKFSDLSKSNVTQDQVNAMFGDRSVAVPDGIERPLLPGGHWPDADLDGPESYTKWHAWQARGGYEARADGE